MTLNIGDNYLEPGPAYFYRKTSDAIPPRYKTSIAACADIALPRDIRIKPREVDIYKTGLVLIPPVGWHWHVYLRSSIPLRYPGLILANCVGIIDSDYNGPDDELGLVLLNQSADIEYQIEAETRIAQIRLVPNVRPTEFKELKHGQIQQQKSRGGYGSTGIC